MSSEIPSETKRKKHRNADETLGSRRIDVEAVYMPFAQQILEALFLCR